MSDRTERKTTFVVQVSDGQKDTLQGQFTWLDHNVTRSFQNTTELVHLIDSLREKLEEQQDEKA